MNWADSEKNNRQNDKLNEGEMLGCAGCDQWAM